MLNEFGEGMASLASKGRKRLLVCAALALVFCVGLSLYLSLGFGALQTPKTDSTDTQHPISVSPTPAPAFDVAADNLTDADTAPLPGSQENVTIVTQQQALELALPIIQKYASENNRSIENITATYGMMADLEGKRGEPSMDQVLAMNLTPQEKHNQFSYYPVWTVSAVFDSRLNHGSWDLENGKAPSNPQILDFWL